jgi:hypothetical protein
VGQVKGGGRTSKSPCAVFMRTTHIPAPKSLPIISTLLVLGPIVHTKRVLHFFPFTASFGE